MEELLCDILDVLRCQESMSAEELNTLIMSYNKRERAHTKKYAKRRLLPFYFEMKEHDYERWKCLKVDEVLEQRLLATLRLKPRRSASGVVSVTVLTKPHACPGNCIFCPNDISMPKSYLHAEPACQRAERCYFDPYLQVMGRLRSLYLMGHPIAEVELVILGGSWTHYSKDYRLWFAKEMYRALNDWDSAHIPCFSAFCAGEDGSKRESGTGFTVAPNATPAAESATVPVSNEAHTGNEVSLSALPSKKLPLSWENDDVSMRQQRYRNLFIPNEHEKIAALCKEMQEKVNAQLITYNEAIEKLYENPNCSYAKAAVHQSASQDVLEHELRKNETAQARCVGLSLETRPDCIDEQTLTEMISMGCDKLQLGVQSLDEHVLQANGRAQNKEKVLHALDLARSFGMRVHAHYMLNLYGSNQTKDLAGFKKLAAGGLCDEVKLYPCVLTEGTQLEQLYKQGKWKPYTDEELIDLCALCVQAAQPWLRISRMVRDISTDDILAGNKKPNLRQMVDDKLQKLDVNVQEIRHRELATQNLEPKDVKLDSLNYETNISEEYFLQLLNSEEKIVALCRLSFPFEKNYSIIRELHMYGTGEVAQKFAPKLCEQLINAAIGITKNKKRSSIQVITTPGRKLSYENLGFAHLGIYLRYNTSV